MGYKTVWVPEQPYIAPTPYIPGTPGSPGVPSSPAQIVSDYNLGWNAGATSIKFIKNSGVFKFKANTNIVGVVTGFNSSNEGVSYFEIDNAFYLTHGTYQVYENGVSKTVSTSYTSNSLFEIKRLYGIVYYIVDGVIVYTSLNTSNGIIFADISMYMADDGLTYAELSDIFEVSSNSLGSGELINPNDVYSEVLGLSTTYSSPQVDGVYSVSSISTGVASSSSNAVRNAKVSSSSNGISSSSSNANKIHITTANLTIGPIDGYSSNKSFTTANLTIGPIDGYGESGSIVPSFTIVDEFIANFTLSTEVKTGEIGSSNLTIGPIDGYATDHNLTTSNLILEPIFGYSGVSIPVTDYCVINQPKSTINSSGNIGLVISTVLIQTNSVIISNAIIEGTTTNNCDALLNQPKSKILSTQHENIALLNQPKSNIISGSVVYNLLKSTIKQPKSKLISSVSKINSSSIVIKQPKSIIKSSDGYIFIGKNIAKQKINSNVINGYNSTIDVIQPKSKLISSVSKINSGSFLHTKNTILKTLNSIDSIIIQPKSKLISSVDLFINRKYKQYVFNLTHNESSNPNEKLNHELTIYDNFNFKKILRLKDKYYALGEDGLYLLGGDTDNGSKINYSFETHKTDFDNNNFKTISSVYLEGKVNSKIKYTLIKGEDGENQYEYYNERGYNAMNTRIKLGKGVKSVYYGFKIEDSSDDLSNDKIVIDNINLEVDILNRRI